MKEKRELRCFSRGSLSKIVLKMKLLAFLMFSVLAASAADGYSQATKFNLELDNVAVKEVFDHVEKNSEFMFLYNEKWVDVDRRVDIKVKNGTIEKVLDQAFKNTRHVYKIYDRQVVILKDEQSEIPATVQKEFTKTENQMQQQKEIKGRVTDTDDLPLPGVSVIVKGTTRGTVTNSNGEFSLTIPADADSLQFSFVGMQTKEFSIGDRTTFSIVMEEGTIGLEEVVAIGYGTKNKATITGSLTSIQNEELKRIPAANVANALTGRLSGVTFIQQSGEPGADDPIIRIRGISSLV